jgi:multiple sugar transport system ATP-binding protein
MASVTLDAIDKRFGDQHIIKSVSVDIRDGEFCVLVGPSGSGKSTLLRIIAGLEDVSGGAVRIGGRDVTHLHPKDRDIAMVFQSYALYPQLTVRENMGFSLKLAKRPKAEIDRIVGEIAHSLALDTLLDRYPRQLSGSASAWRWAARSCASRRCSCSTSHCPTWTPRCATTCVPRSANCTSACAPLACT